MMGGVVLTRLAGASVAILIAARSIQRWLVGGGVWV
jgi:hypothetical protein